MISAVRPTCVAQGVGQTCVAQMCDEPVLCGGAPGREMIVLPGGSTAGVEGALECAFDVGWVLLGWCWWM